MWRGLLIVVALVFGSGIAEPAQAQDLRRLQEQCSNSDGNRAVCLEYALAAQASGNRDQVDRGTKVLTASCLAGYAPACYRSGLAAKANIPGAGYADWEISTYFRGGCDGGDGASCYELGYLYLTGEGVDYERATALALFRKSCGLKYSDGCEAERIVAPAGPGDALYSQIPPIDPALPAITQLAQAGAIVERTQAGDRQSALNTVVRLMEESDAGGQWLLAEWFAKGIPGLLEQHERNAAILFENAAKQGHVDAMIEYGMVLWYGYGVRVDQDLGKAYMRTAANRGSAMAEAIWRSMEAEPIRQANARRQREMEEMMASQRASASRRIGSAVSSWSSASTSSYNSSSVTASWGRYEAQRDQTNFDNAMRYITGSSSACPSFNPYC